MAYKALDSFPKEVQPFLRIGEFNSPNIGLNQVYEGSNSYTDGTRVKEYVFSYEDSFYSVEFLTHGIFATSDKYGKHNIPDTALFQTVQPVQKTITVYEPIA